MTTSQPRCSLPGEILIVDDVPANLQLLAALLRREGYSVRCATGGSIALRSAQSFPPELILLDITMPEMDGYEVCRRLKSDSVTAEIPVIFVSALDEAMLREPVLSAGGMGYIAKPYRLQDVLNTVRRVLESPWSVNSANSVNQVGV